MNTRNTTLTLLILLAGILLSPSAFSQQTSVKNDTTKKEEKQGLTFELSFGSSVLFIAGDKQNTIFQQGGVVVPTSALLFFAEFRPLKRMRIPVFFNLPTETKQFLVNGVIVNQKANITFGTGLEFKIAQFKISDQTRVDLEVGPLASCIVGSNWNFRFAPIATGRMRIVKNDSFAMYFGTSYSVGINVWGLIYGTGYIF
ncbi:MAG: hypothetical protein MUC87_08420 [Bacteroidia bacterium]|jgi:hypothetical protein|nr:hypothetical protein [Bacteroidia bacterium]